MNLEMSRIYKDIIEEVMNKLENEGEAFNISRSVIFDLQNGWAQKIRASAEAKNENVYEHGVYRGFNSYVDIKNPEVENYDSDDYELLEEEEGF